MNTKKWSRALSLTAIAAVAAVALAGCGRSAGPATDSSAAPISDGAATGKITVWAMGDGSQVEAILPKFKAANPDADVEVTSIPWGNAYEKISAAIAAQTLPDVVQVGTTWMGEWGGAGAFDPTPEGIVSEDDFYPGPWSTTVVDGVQYGIPRDVDPGALVYRKDLADEAGLTAPKTWDELKTFATTLQSKGLAKYGIYVPVSGVGLWATVTQFAFQAGGEITNEDESAYTFDNDEWKKGLTFYSDLVQSGVAPNRLLQAAQEDITAFVDGEIGSFYASPAFVDLIIQQGGPDFASKIGIATVPAENAGGTPSTVVGGSDFAVASNSSNRDGAWKLLKYLASADTQTAWFKEIGSLPANKLGWTDEITSDPIISQFQDGLEYGKAVPAVGTWAQVSSVLDNQFERAIAGASTPSDALTEIQKQADSIGTGR